MSEGSIEVMRETSRNFLVLNRRKNRDEESDIRRSMTNLWIDSDTVLSIAQKLKTKSMMTVSELQMLKNALLDDESNIQIVLNTNGSLRGLVRELTGHDVNKQCAAAGCCCNLALGDGRAGVAVSKSAGTYLVAALDNLTTELAVTSAWTLGNLAGSGLKACQLLVAQGAVAKLVELLDSTNEEMKDSVLYALVRFAHQLKNDLKTEHLHNMMSKLPYQEVNSSSQLLFILSCHSEFTPDLISKDLISKILQYLLVNIEQVENINITYIFRFFANSYSKEIFEEVLCYLLNNDMLLLIKLLLEINESVLWFVGNAFKLCSDNVFFEMLFR